MYIITVSFFLYYIFHFGFLLVFMIYNVSPCNKLYLQNKEKYVTEITKWIHWILKFGFLNFILVIHCSFIIFILTSFFVHKSDASFDFKITVRDIRYFARSKFSRSLVHKKNVSLIWQVVLKLGYAFYQER